MGVTITATNSPYEFDMSYGGFFNLRKNIAFALDKEFGENYALLAYCFTESQLKKNDEVANRIIEITENGIIDRKCTYDEYLESKNKMR